MHFTIWYLFNWTNRRENYFQKAGRNDMIFSISSGQWAQYLFQYNNNLVSEDANLHHFKRLGYKPTCILAHNTKMSDLIHFSQLTYWRPEIPEIRQHHPQEEGGQQETSFHHQCSPPRTCLSQGLQDERKTNSNYLPYRSIMCVHCVCFYTMWSLYDYVYEKNNYGCLLKWKITKLFAFMTYQGFQCFERYDFVLVVVEALVVKRALCQNSQCAHNYCQSLKEILKTQISKGCFPWKASFSRTDF